MSARMQREHRKLDHILQTTGSKLIRNFDSDYETFLKVRILFHLPRRDAVQRSPLIYRAHHPIRLVRFMIYSGHRNSEIYDSLIIYLLPLLSL